MQVKIMENDWEEFNGRTWQAVGASGTLYRVEKVETGLYRNKPLYTVYADGRLVRSTVNGVDAAKWEAEDFELNDSVEH